MHCYTICYLKKDFFFKIIFKHLKTNNLNPVFSCPFARQKDMFCFFKVPALFDFFQNTFCYFIVVIVVMMRAWQFNRFNPRF